jgi:uncharacterized protein YegL
MAGGPIAELNRGFQLFCEHIRQEDPAGQRAGIAVITVDASARAGIGFTGGRGLGTPAGGPARR